MSYGLEVLGPTGNKVVSITNQGILFRETFSVPGTASTTTKSYPEWTGRTGAAVAFCGINDQADFLDLVWSYPSGVPTLAATRRFSMSGTHPTISVYVFIQ